MLAFHMCTLRHDSVGPQRSASCVMCFVQTTCNPRKRDSAAATSYFLTATKSPPLSDEGMLWSMLISCSNVERREVMLCLLIH